MAEPKLEIAKHVKYWHRCLNSLLPTAYTSTDSTRMTLGFFILSALDLLGGKIFENGFCGVSILWEDSAARVIIVIRIYITRMETGRGSCEFGRELFRRADLGAGGWDREGKEKGLFELVEEAAEGGWQFWGVGDGGWEEREEGTDIDVESLVEHLRRGQAWRWLLNFAKTYDGGISESSEHEAHAGYAYCAIASLSLLDRLPKPTSGTETSESERTSAGLTNLPETLRWLVLRQSAYTDGDGEEEDEEQQDSEQSAPDHFFVLDADPTFVGFNGRCNKRADTCYTFWVGASLNMLGHSDLINKDGARRFLLEKTQHMIGGFGKTPGDPPDIYHSYLGLAILAALKEPGLKELDSALCISVEAKKNLEELRRAALVPSKTYWKHGYSFLVREDSPEFGSKMAAGESPPKSLLDAFEGVKLEG
ncbi:hypothetical protein CJF30_00005427 [Rutstroemia sp. NJR-2017a BBW]|nr:hypothetical protein CJF30_00005957 [Rutstroemia sp. NJR-2017a BBW]PQE08551.1 hypothetical protein CJF30_00005427 [Rutstroemia sp. NJR-2017a BBW]